MARNARLKFGGAGRSMEPATGAERAQPARRSGRTRQAARLVAAVTGLVSALTALVGACAALARALS
jgi:hypothetical protein